MELKKTSRLIGVAFRLVGIVWLLLSFYLLTEGLQRKQYESNYNAETLVGVVGYETRSPTKSIKNKSASSTSYYPIYEYQEETHRYTSSSGGGKSSHPLGSTRTAPKIIDKYRLLLESHTYSQLY